MNIVATKQTNLVSSEECGGDAIIEGPYRYQLRRWWSREGKTLLWILFNPSTADAMEDDATLRRLISFTKREGYSGLTVVNLFAYRTPYPKELRRIEDPLGPRNNHCIEDAASRAENIILAWGNTPFGSKHPFASREHDVLHLLTGPLYCFGTTHKGCPLHPLYLPNENAFERFPSLPHGEANR